MAGQLGRSIYSSREWKRVRLAVLTRDGYRCRVCGHYAVEVHHIKALVDGGAPFDLTNLEARCRDCHIDTHANPGRRAWRRLVVEVAG